MSLPNKTGNWLKKYRDSILLLGGVLIGFVIILVFFIIHDFRNDSGLISNLRPRNKIPISVIPGPLRKKEFNFHLQAEQAQKLTGMNDPENERWSDIAGNIYATEFINSFSYEGKMAQVLLAFDKTSDTLRGRLEAKGLKPNFAYQIKLRGIFENFESFEKIGYAGRWRFPGKGTNYTDAQYESRKDKSDVEAYLLFDFFVTDKKGDAVRDFELDSSLHVLWNASRQQYVPNGDDVIPIIVDASSKKYYSLPKKNRNIELLWCERQTCRYKTADQKRFLPKGKYDAELVLTEESFHSAANDGGYWATVFKGEIEFEVE